jgi:SAM-dependent methyltransferase
MYVVERSLSLVRNAIANYGPRIVKKALWDKEYLAGQWNFNDDTANDALYPHLVRHAKGGSILDLGCGSGNTANELDRPAYRTYVGVDISEAALAKARTRTEQNGRKGKCMFLVGDILGYVPAQRFDVILFRHSLYMVPLNKVKPTLDRYSKYLTDSGVFVVSIRTTRNGQKKKRPITMVCTIEAGFDIIEERQYPEPGPTVIVFRPRAITGSKGNSPK